MNTDYFVLIQGGEGPDVWDRGLKISAVDFTDAAAQACGLAEGIGGHVANVAVWGYVEPSAAIIEKLTAENVEANGRLDMQMKDLAQLRANYKHVGESYDQEIQRLMKLRELVTQDHETKEAFIERVRAIIAA